MWAAKKRNGSVNKRARNRVMLFCLVNSLWEVGRGTRFVVYSKQEHCGAFQGRNDVIPVLASRFKLTVYLAMSSGQKDQYSREKCWLCR
jgi:hypothetical protein